MAHESLGAQTVYIQSVHKRNMRKTTTKKKSKKKNKTPIVNSVINIETQHEDVSTYNVIEATGGAAATDMPTLEQHLDASVDANEQDKTDEATNDILEELCEVDDTYEDKDPIRTHEDYLGKLSTNDNVASNILQGVKHAVSIVKRRFMTQHHSFMSPGGNIGRLKRSQKPLQWRRHSRNINQDSNERPLRRTQSYFRLDS